MIVPSLNDHDELIFIYQQQLIIQPARDWSLIKVADMGAYFSSLLIGAEFFEVGDVFIGEQLGQKCYVVNVSKPVEEVSLAGFRSLMGIINHREGQLVSRALQVITWKQQHQYCGQCGGKTQPHKEDMALVCNNCDITFYPRISPCIMCLVVKDDYCLLAHHARYKTPMYSTLAGFVESGETLEHAVQREVREEVGVIIGSLRYFSSQPWPFPHQLMVGFFAEYQAGEIVEDGIEIMDAQWFRYDNLPEIPPLETLSGKLINQFVEQCQQAKL